MVYICTYVPVSHYVCVANMSTYHILLFLSGTSVTAAATATTAATASTSINAQPSGNPKGCAKDSSSPACQMMTDDETGNDTVY